MNTATPKTATELLNRLNESERIRIRSANPDRLEWLRNNDFLGDNISSEEMIKVQQSLNSSFMEFETKKWWVTQTWAL